MVVKIGDHPLPLSSEDHDATVILDFLAGSLQQKDVGEEETSDEPIGKATKKRNRKRGLRR